MLGMLSQDALSAVSLAGQAMFVFNLFLSAFSMGTSMIAAQYWGKGNRKAVEKALAFVLRASLLVSLLFFRRAVFPQSGYALFYIFAQAGERRRNISSGVCRFLFVLRRIPDLSLHYEKQRVCREKQHNQLNGCCH